MKIVMDFRKYSGVIGGVEQGVIQITKHITANGHSIVLLCKENILDKVRNLFADVDNLKIAPLQVNTHIMTRKNVVMDSTAIQDIAENEGADVIHFYYNWGFPVRKKAPSVLTVHDVIPFTFREAQGFFNNFVKYKPGIRKACRLNDIITTVSEFSRQDIAEKVGVPLNKIKVIHNGLRGLYPADKGFEDKLRERFHLKDRFILNVGGIHERKNIVRLIYAFSRLVNQEGYSGKLVITGKVAGAPYQDKMKRICDKAVREAGVGKRVLFTDFISERELDFFFRRADLLIYPSLYEGFGIPVLEAMKVGLPVVTSNLTAMPEVVGDAAVLIDPYSLENMTAAMSKVIHDDRLREGLKQKGFKQAQSFTWEKTSKEYLDIYEEISMSCRIEHKTLS